MKTGFIGLGSVGGKLAGSLLRNGIELSVHDLDRERMEAFAERFGFHFVAHAVGHANRSARVERPFAYIERNFYPGRTFQDLADLNRQLAAWCDQVAGRTLRALQQTPAQRFEAERSELVPLPLYVPDVYALHARIVDVEGLIHLHTNRYSVDEALIGRRPEGYNGRDAVACALALDHDGVWLPFGGFSGYQPETLAPNVYRDEWGITHHRPKDNGFYYSVVDVPLPQPDLSVEDICNYPWPEVGNPERMAGLRELALNY